MRPCKLCGAPAIEQVRGELTEADKGYVAPHGTVGFDGVNSDASSNNPANATDTRVVCSNTQLAMRGHDGKPIILPAEGKAWNRAYDSDGLIFPVCDAATGWNKAEYADYTRFKWDRDHGATE